MLRMLCHVLSHSDRSHSGLAGGNICFLVKRSQRGRAFGRVLDMNYVPLAAWHQGGRHLPAVIAEEERNEYDENLPGHCGHERDAYCGHAGRNQ